MRFPAVCIAFLLLTPAQAAVEAQFPLVAGDGGLPAFFDCVRANGIVISAHRGGAVPGYPENAIETIAHTLSRIPAMPELDVATSKDGTLVLMHDETLDRTSTGSGPVNARSDAELAALRLQDNDGQLTDFRIPTLRAALDAVRGQTIVVIDRKSPTTFDAIITEIEAAKAEDFVILATYTNEDVIAVHRRNPRLMIGASIESTKDLDAIEQAGIDSSRILAWTGVVAHRPYLYPLLAARGVESMFGTIGVWPRSFDNLVKASGDDRLYLWLSDGLQVIATDRMFEVAAVLPRIAAAQKACSAKAGDRVGIEPGAQAR